METTKQFVAIIPQAAKTLTKFVGTDCRRPQFKNVVLLPDKGIITATDTHILQLVRVEIDGDFAPGLVVNIDPRHISKIAGEKVVITALQTELGQCTGIECNGETYTTEAKNYRFPDVLRAIPNDKDLHIIELTPDSLNALKKLCKVFSKQNYISIRLEQGRNIAVAAADVINGVPTAEVVLKLAKPSEITALIGLAPQLLAATLDGCNGKIGITDEYHTIKIYGNADETVICPTLVNDEATRRLSDFPASESTFAEDAEQIVIALRSAAQRFWQYIVQCYSHGGGCSLKLGNYTASEVARCKPLKDMLFPTDSSDFAELLSISAGNIRLKLLYRDIFYILAQWEKIVKGNATFSVGQVEETTATILEPDGNKVSERKLKLRKLGGGWYTTARRKAKDWEAPVYCEVNGHIIYIRHLSTGTIDDSEVFAAWADGKAKQIPGIIIENAVSEGGYFAELVEKTGIATGAKQISPKEKGSTPKKFHEITTERKFISKLRAYYRSGRRKGYQRQEISFLGLMECTSTPSKEFEYFSEKYFSLAAHAYDWQRGNSLLSALIDKWENELKTAGQSKQRTTLAETPRNCTRTPETGKSTADTLRQAQTA